MERRKTTDQLLSILTRRPAYHGKEVVVVDGEVHILTARSKSARTRLLKLLKNKYPNSTPTIAFIPREDSLILVDSGADYTILPKDDAVNLGVDLEKDCLKKATRGIGGNQTVYFLKRKARVKVGGQPFSIPLGFLNSNQIPPLLGREGCLNLFRVLLAHFRTEISL